MRYIFIINGRQNYAGVREDVIRQASELHFEYSIYTTIGVGDATRYTRIYCDLHPTDEVCFVACGGSGTCNEVASGIVGSTNKLMAVLAYGTTNDLLKCFPEYDFLSIKKILSGSEIRLDILKVNDDYALNTCNFGFDAIVAKEANYLLENNRKYPYERGIFNALFYGRFNRIKVIADGKPLNNNYLLSCALGNGKYVGGQFLCTPNADLTDGLMDICLIKAIPLFRFFKILPHYKKGEHVGEAFEKHIVHTRAKHVDIYAKNLINVVLDGEILPGTEFSVDVLPQEIRFVLPELP